MLQREREMDVKRRTREKMSIENVKELSCHTKDTKDQLGHRCAFAHTWRHIFPLTCRTSPGYSLPNRYKYKVSFEVHSPSPFRAVSSQFFGTTSTDVNSKICDMIWYDTLKIRPCCINWIWRLASWNIRYLPYEYVSLQWFATAQPARAMLARGQ